MACQVFFFASEQKILSYAAGVSFRQCVFGVPARTAASRSAGRLAGGLSLQGCCIRKGFLWTDCWKQPGSHLGPSTRIMGKKGFSVPQELLKIARQFIAGNCFPKMTTA